jgi:hypothetical protein
VGCLASVRFRPGFFGVRTRPGIRSNRSRNVVLPSGRPVPLCTRKSRSSSGHLAPLNSRQPTTNSLGSKTLFAGRGAAQERSDPIAQILPHDSCRVQRFGGAQGVACKSVIGAGNWSITPQDPRASVAGEMEWRRMPNTVPAIPHRLSSQMPAGHARAAVAWGRPSRSIPHFRGGASCALRRSPDSRIRSSEPRETPVSERGFMV